MPTTTRVRNLDKPNLDILINKIDLCYVYICVMIDFSPLTSLGLQT